MMLYAKMASGIPEAGDADRCVDGESNKRVGSSVTVPPAAHHLRK
jgi:hypothetical protein